MTDVALIRFRKHEDSVVYTLLEQREQKFIASEHGTAPKYDMSKVPAIHQTFKIPEEKYKRFLEVLQSKEGHAIVNMLKNKKTNEIINEYLKIEKEKIEPLSESKSKHYNLLYFLEDMMAENMGETQNSLPRKLICLTKEDIFNEFVNKGLIK